MLKSIATITQSLRAVVVLTLVTGVAYTLAVMAVARVIAPDKALGSRVRDRSGQLVGSRLIGQAFSKPEYLWPRPSAAGAGYDATASGGSNVSPVGSDATTRIAAERERLHAANPDAPGEVPALLLTTSASGLDPDLSPEAARWQLPRIAKARGIEVRSIEALLADPDIAEGRTLGVLGEPRVNVLLFNLELDKRWTPRR